MHSARERRNWVLQIKSPRVIIGTRSVTLVGPSGQLKLGYNNLYFEENILNFLGIDKKQNSSSP